MSIHDSNSIHTRSLGRFERNRYFPRKLVTAEDELTEQGYYANRLNTFVRHVVDDGIVCGLRATLRQETPAAELEVTVHPGYGFDGYGRQVVVPRETEQRLSPPDGTVVHLYLQYDECHKESVPIPGSDDACEEECEYNRILEIFEVVYGAEPEPEAPPEITYPTPTAFEADRRRARLTMARSYFESEGVLRPCDTSERDAIFLGTWRRADGEWTRDGGVDRRFVYKLPFLHELTAQHVTKYGTNPHWVGVDVTDTGDNTASLLIEGPENPGGTVSLSSDGTVSFDVTTPPDPDDPTELQLGVTGLEGLDGRVTALERYIRRRSMVCKLTSYAVVADEFDDPDVQRFVDDIVDETEEALEVGDFEDPEEYAEYIGRVVPFEQNLEAVLQRLATDRSRRRFSRALGRLAGIERAAENALELAMAQDCTSEAAEWLERATTVRRCVGFDDLDEPDEYAFDHRELEFDLAEDSDEEPELVRDGLPRQVQKLVIPESGLLVHTPESEGLSVTVFTRGDIVALTARDEDDEDIFRRETGEQAGRYTFEVTDERVASVVLTGGNGEAYLVEVCLG
jgi:hypothetical protein